MDANPARGAASRGWQTAPISLADATLLTLATWSALLASAALVERGAEPICALSAAFVFATGLALAAQPCRRGRGSPLALLGLGLAAGCASYPAWVTGVSGLGRALGWSPASVAPPGPPSAWLSLALTQLVLGPVMEELVYRGCLLPALAARFGRVSGVLGSSAAFALPHLEPWSVLTTFAVGLGLGAVALASGAVSLCIGVHAGLNLGASVSGVPPVRLHLSPAAGAGVGAALVGVGVAWCRLDVRTHGRSRDPARSPATRAPR